MKIALITDTHFGARSDSQQFDAYFKKFYDDIFFPTLEERNVKEIFHLGDTFDRRKYINFNSLRSCRQYFFGETVKRNIEMTMIAGNHDTFFKNTNDVNSIDLLLGEYDNITTVDQPTQLQFDKLKVLVLPWLCADNFEKSMNLVKNTEATVCFGHLELAGFSMFKGQESHEGMDPSVFNKFKLVCSGHYHHRQGKGNIQYLGNPYQMTWSDYEDQRGFHIFDTEDLSLEFIHNPYTMFEKYYYDDEKEDPLTVDVNTYAGRMLKVIVANKKDFYKFDTFIEKIYKVNPIELKIIEDFSEFETEALDETLNLEDTMTLLTNYVDSVETDVDKDRLKSVLRTLYVEAQHYEEA